MPKKNRKGIKIEFIDQHQPDVTAWDFTKKTVIVEFTSEVMRSDVLTWSRRVTQYAIKLHRIHQGTLKGLPKVNMGYFIIAVMKAITPFLNLEWLAKLSIQQRFACYAVIQTLTCIANTLESSKELMKIKEKMSAFLFEYANHFKKDYVEMSQECDLAAYYNIADPRLAENEWLPETLETGSQCFFKLNRLAPLTNQQGHPLPDEDAAIMSLSILMDDVITQELDKAKISFAHIGLKQYKQNGFSMEKLTHELERWQSQLNDQMPTLKGSSIAVQQAHEALREEIDKCLPEKLYDLGFALSLS